MNVLVIAAHPDDEVLGMGGTIKKFTKKGNKVKIVIMATGILARRSSNHINATIYDLKRSTKKESEKQIIQLRKHAKSAAKIMGVKDIEFLDFPDNEMDTVSNLQVTKTAEKIIEDFKPFAVYTHSPNDINIDHRIVYNATITATRPANTNSVKEVLSFEVPSSSEWNFGEAFKPNVFVDISKELPAKLKAMSAYKKELRKFPHPRSLKGLEYHARRWGTVAGFQAAEAFSLVRQLKS